jgi:ABC-2 type transport system permease protein
MACVPLAVFVFCFRGYVVLPAGGLALVAFAISLVLTALLQFFISYTMAMLAFWMLEISTFIFILFAFEFIASGHLFPLDLLPPALQHALFFTPFPSMLYMPISIYMGKTSGAGIWLGLLMQLLWLLLAYRAARFMWSRGIRKYAAFGG